MGAENSILEGCEWGPPLDCPPKFPFEMYPVTKPDGTAATVFEPRNADSKDSDLLRKLASNLRGLRHPNIVRFIGCDESSEGFWLATESVTPLSNVLTDMSSDELSAGLYDLLQAIDFLHSKLGICHNNICIASIFVSSDGIWKLGGLEHSCKFTEATQGFLEKCRAFRHEDCLSPEEKTNNVKVDGSLGHARDIFAFGAFVDTVLEMIKDKDAQMKTLEQQTSVCVSVDPASRPKASDLLSLSALRSDLREIVNFLRYVTMKSEPEKKEFFSTLVPRLRRLPEQTIARKLVVPLLARFVLLNEWADKLVIPHLLLPKGGASTRNSSMQGLLSEPLFRQYVVNHLYNIFHVHDNHIRLVLLEHFSNYAHLFTRQQLENDIFPQILLGVRDTDDKLVSASLRALADLVPILGGDLVIGGARKCYFFHGLPKQVSPADLKKMEAPSNISAALSSQKPLLKTLAASSASNKAENEKIAAERERKAKEREQRREEARLKREERRKRLKEQQHEKEEKTSQSAADNKPLDLTIEEVAVQDKEDLSLKSRQQEKLENDESDHSNKESDNAPEDDVDLGSTKEAPDWSDWEDTDQKISDEIETELQKMTESGPAEPKVQTSPSPYSRNQSPPSPPPVKVDWSDIPEGEGDIVGRRPRNSNSHSNSKGPLTLGSEHKDKIQHSQQDDVIDNNDINFTDDWGSDNWDAAVNSESTKSLAHEGTISEKSIPASSPVGQKSLKLKQSSAVKPQPKKPPRKNSLDELGVGLDIKSIEIHAKTSSEVDFFADMAPAISDSKSKDPLSLLASTLTGGVDDSDPLPNGTLGHKASTTEAASPKTHKLFAVVAEPDEDAAGWGGGDDADLNWGNEDF